MPGGRTPRKRALLTWPLPPPGAQGAWACSQGDWLWEGQTQKPAQPRKALCLPCALGQRAGQVPVQMAEQLDTGRGQEASAGPASAGQCGCAVCADAHTHHTHAHTLLTRLCTCTVIAHMLSHTRSHSHARSHFAHLNIYTHTQYSHKLTISHILSISCLPAPRYVLRHTRADTHVEPRQEDPNMESEAPRDTAKGKERQWETG